ncbi:MAG: adenosylcobinamide-GDP ribazoletransferase [Anaerolineae bacterium]
MLQSFLVAWGFLTAIPLPFVEPRPETEPGRAFAWFPLVGLVLGLGLAGLAWPDFDAREFQ